MINVEILKKELLKQDSVESCFNDEYREMMACIAGAVDCSIEKIERFLTDYGRLTRINQMTYVSREHVYAVNTSIPKTLVRSLVNEVGHFMEVDGFTGIAPIIDDIILQVMFTSSRRFSICLPVTPRLLRSTSIR